MPEFNKDEVRTFLRKFKSLLAAKNFHLVERDKTDQTLIKLGLTRKNMRDELLGLTVLDYCSGPDPDLNKPGNVWVFGKLIEDQEIYVKLKVVEIEAFDEALCLSFHIAEKPLKYPHKE